MNDELLLLKYLKALDALEKIREALPERESTRSAWVGLTDEEVIKCLGAEAVRIPTGWSKLTQAIEAKLKEKNT